MGRKIFHSWIVFLGLGIILSFPSQAQARRVRIIASQPAHTYRILGPNERLFPPPFIYPNQTILEDESGKAYIVLDKDHRYDYLAYLLGKDFFNIAEVRIIKASEVAGTELSNWMSQRGLSQVGISRLVQDYSYQELPRQENSLEALFVFWMFLGDGDHDLFDHNMHYLTDANGKRIYMSFDHDRMMFYGINSITDFFLRQLFYPNRRSTVSYLVNSKDIIIAIARQAQQYYTDERLEKTVEEAGLGAGLREDVLRFLKNRRDSLATDTETLLERFEYLKYF